MLLDVIPGAAGSSGSSSSSSSVFQGGAVLGAARRQGFVATAGLIYRQEGLSGFTRGWQVRRSEQQLSQQLVGDE
jgi:hypothetical protein